jgi:hypothetical protein
VRTNQAARSGPNLVDKPETIGPALAQVLRIDENGRDQILGQAWLAAPNRLVTCGHVIEPFFQNQQGMTVLFPASGKRYPIAEIRMHPSFVRQPDGLVRFDVALLTVQLAPPDSLAEPLPFSYEQGELHTNQRLWTIRFPAHLGQFSAAVQPLSQDGRFLGLLRKHDSFHLLHDLPLAPGDSGAPICDARGIVAIHCGDTATIPGLNLATTSIRLALWIEALRELGVAETRKTYLTGSSRMTALVAFLLMFGIAFGAGYAAFRKPAPQPVPIAQPEMTPLRISFNKAPDQYKKGQPIQITLEPTTPCYPFIMMGQEGLLMTLYPSDGIAKKLTDSKLIDQDSTAEPLTAPNTAAMKLYILAAKAGNADGEQFARNFSLEKMYGKNPKLVEQKMLDTVNEFDKDHPGLVTLTEFNIPPGK